MGARGHSDARSSGTPFLFMHARLVWGKRTLPFVMPCHVPVAPFVTTIVVGLVLHAHRTFMRRVCEKEHFFTAEGVNPGEVV